MFQKIKSELETIIGRLSASAQSYNLLVIVFSIALISLSVTYIKNNIGINTDTENMLSEDLPWRIAYKDFKANFPFFADSIVVVTDAISPDLAEDVANSLAKTLADDPKHYESVTHLREHPFFRRNQFLYLSSEELDKLSNNISRSQAMLSQLLDDPTGTRLIETIDKAVVHREQQSIDGLDSIILQISKTIEATSDNQLSPMSWQNILNGETSETTKPNTPKLNNRIIFTVKPVMDFSAILPAEKVIKHLHEEIEKLETEYPGLVNIRLTGGAALSHDEMSSVIDGSLDAGLLALCLVFLCLFVGLRSWVLVLSTLATLLFGLTVTAVFAITAVGTLNMISIAFAVLYVGLGVDFAIHICLRYRELSDEHIGSQSQNELINAATKQVGASIALCALTTAIGFFAFIPTDYKGVAELGLIAGVGMFVSLFTSVTVLPALLQALPTLSRRQRSPQVETGLKLVSHKNAKLILVIAGCLWFVASISVSFISFDIDPVRLNDQKAESVRLLAELNSNGDNSSYAVSVLANDRAVLTSVRDALNEVVSIKSVKTVDSLIPTDQEEKFTLIDDLVLILGDGVTPNPDATVNPEELKSALENLVMRLQSVQINEQTKMLQAALDDYLTHLKTLTSTQSSDNLVLLNRNLMESFSARMNRLNDALDPSGVDLEKLPAEIRERWVSANSIYRIEAIPREDLSTNASLRAFVNDIQRVVDSKATGAAIINVGAADAVQTAFIEAFCYALTLITILLWVILRSLKEVIVSLFPLLLAGLLTCCVMVVSGLNFNFANIIALPLLLGIGVDSALHLLHRYKTDTSPSVDILRTSTARAVFFSAATTTVSFGTLAASSHTGTASMGVVLSIGIVVLLFCMLIILPAMLLMFVQRETTLPNRGG